VIDLNDIVVKQSALLFGFIPAWGIVLQPIAAITFIVAAFAETNRTPFDLAEGESEIVGGFHTEYGAMKFGLFFVVAVHRCYKIKYFYHILCDNISFAPV